MRKFNIKDIVSNKKALYFVLGIILVSVLSLTIVYAALSTVLNITGSTQITASNWDIHLANAIVKDGSVSANAPSLYGDSLSFSVNLDKPGDFYEFTVDAINEGTLDAMIDSVVKTPELTSEQSKYIKYEICYVDGTSISTNQILRGGTRAPIKVRVEYRTDLSAGDLPSSTTELNLKLKIIYVQSDGSGSGTSGGGSSVVRVVSGDGTQVGDEICVSEECFYVISSDETSVTMLAKYNLYVGNYNDGHLVRLLSEPTGKQDSRAIGGKWDEDLNDLYPFVATTAFSNVSSNYSGSLVEGYVNDYNNYLILLGIIPIESRLITYDELVMFGCVELDGKCTTEYSWIYLTSYWSGSFVDDKVWHVDSDGFFNIFTYTHDGSYGVRPVITISKDYL